jgi:hypothetical protein
VSAHSSYGGLSITLLPDEHGSLVKQVRFVVYRVVQKEFVLDRLHDEVFTASAWQVGVHGSSFELDTDKMNLALSDGIFNRAHFFDDAPVRHYG